MLADALRTAHADRVQRVMSLDGVSPGARLWEAVEGERPTQIVGVINAYSALLAEQAGFRALYVSGAGVANASYGRPDLGLTSLDDVRTDVARIADVTALPVLVDADTGWESDDGIARTVQELSAAGAAGVHLEDQVEAKRCGHRPNKVLVSTDTMLDRIDAAAAARIDSEFVIMARTDAAGVEGLDAAIDRARDYVGAGADMIFAEALTELDQYRRFCDAVPAPVLANITEFGLTPLFTTEELAQVGVRLILYPLSAFRAMSAAAAEVFTTIRRDGTQAMMVDRMQTRADLYDVLNYEHYEQMLDAKQLAAP